MSGGHPPGPRGERRGESRPSPRSGHRTRGIGEVVGPPGSQLIAAQISERWVGPSKVGAPRDGRASLRGPRAAL
eukprot:3263215-Pyramimonas_sp.AAC.1